MISYAVSLFSSSKVDKNKIYVIRRISSNIDYSMQCVEFYKAHHDLRSQIILLLWKAMNRDYYFGYRSVHLTIVRLIMDTLSYDIRAFGRKQSSYKENVVSYLKKEPQENTYTIEADFLLLKTISRSPYLWYIMNKATLNPTQENMEMFCRRLEETL